MKKFVFRLQIVLDRAGDEEDAALRRLAELRYAQVQKEQEVAAAQETRQDALARMTRLQEDAFDPRELFAYRLHLEALNTELARLQLEVEECIRRVSAQQLVVIEARRKRQMLEKLKEKQHTEYLQEQERQALKEMEEAVLPRLAREQAAEAARREQMARNAEAQVGSR